MRIITALIVLLFVQTVSASCSTPYDYCTNISLGLFKSTNLTIATSQITLPDTSVCWQPLGGPTYDRQGNCYMPDADATENLFVDTYSGCSDVNYTIVSDAATPMMYIYVDSVFSCPNDDIPFARVCWNGTSIGNTHPTITGPDTDAQQVKTFADYSFNQYYRRNWTFTYERNNSLVHFDDYDNANLEVWCQGLSSFDINMTSRLPNGGSMIIQTEEEPKYILSVNSFGERVRQDKNYYLQDNFYLLDNINNSNTWQFTLLDYSGGDCYKSDLGITRTIEDQIRTVHSQQFEQDNIITAYLQNNTQYGINVDCNSSQRNLGSLLVVDQDRNLEVLISRPDFGGFPFAWDEATIWLTQDRSVPQVGCTINSSSSTKGYFEVFNITSDGGKTLDYYEDSSGSTIVFTKAVDDENGTWIVKCSVNDTTYGLRTAEYKLTFAQLGIDKDIADVQDTIMGMSKDFVYNAMSIVIIVGILALFSSESMGTGAIIGSMAGAGFKYMGWWTAPDIFVAFILFTSIFVKIRERRRGL